MRTLPSETRFRPAYDAIVVGARCAGAATAMLLARRGLRVLAIERGRYGSDTLSTHALMRGGVLQLHRWGLLPRLEATATPAVRTTSFHYGDEEVRVTIKPRDGVDALYAPRRTVLDALLVDAALEAGAQVVFGARAAGLIRSAGGRVGGVLVEDPLTGVTPIQAGIVIGADGLHSTVARRVGARTLHSGGHASAVVYGYWLGLGSDGNHWHYRPGVSVGAIPTNAGQTCIFAATTQRRFEEEIRHDLAAGYHRLLRECAPELASSLAPCQARERLRGFPGEPGFLRQCSGPGWALVGDAGYFKDPLTAHGITDALRDAELLARAVASGSEVALADYQEKRDELALGFFELTDAIASFDWDLETVRELHLAMSREMNREAEALAELGPQPDRAGAFARQPGERLRLAG